MDGADTLNRIRSAYARLSTYQDTGEVVSVFTRASGSLHPRPHHMPFSTWFARPDNFRFDFAQRIGHPNFQKTCSVWQRNFTPHAHGWWTKGLTINGRERLDGLRNMLFYAGMSSHNAATRALRLLMPDQLNEGPALNARLIREDSVAGMLCNVLEVGWANANGSYSETWWVGMDDSLIRQVVSVMDFPTDDSHPLRRTIKADTLQRHDEGKISDKELLAALESFKPENALSRCELTTNYAIIVDAPIADEAFEFHPDK